MNEQFIMYAPVIVVVFIFLVQQRLVVTPEQLERKHIEITKELEEKFVTWQTFNEFKEQFNVVKNEVHQIYEHIMGREE